MTTKQHKRRGIDIPNKYIVALKCKETRAMYKEWYAGIPDGFFSLFVKHGLTSFLKRYGYEMNQSTPQLIQYCKEWAFSHVHIQRKKHISLQRTFLKIFHNGGEEELDWFLFSIPPDDWDAFADQWKCPEFLDESDAGYAQRMDLTLFVWNIVDLVNGRQHAKWVQFNETGDEDDIAYTQTAINPDEGAAFGGDRRTL